MLSRNGAVGLGGKDLAEIVVNSRLSEGCILPAFSVVGIVNTAKVHGSYGKLIKAISSNHQYPPIEPRAMPFLPGDHETDSGRLSDNPPAARS